ncbi:MAG: hemolysin family protein [Marinilabiliales bacterium]|nr:hemolysin family protein [Marinilabiliales bacterium]
MNQLTIIVLTMIASAFFSGMEIAFFSSDKLRLELDKNANSLTGRIIGMFNNHPGQYIATLLVGNNVALVIYSLAFAALTQPLFEPFSKYDSVSLLVQTTLSTLLILIVAEFIPKAVFRINPNLALNLLAVPVAFFYLLFYPITRFAIGVSNFVLRYLFRIKIEQKKENRVFGRIDLNNLFAGLEDSVPEDRKLDSEIKLFQNALDFSKIKIRECMVPRTDVVMISVDEGIEALRQKFVETGYSKIFVYQDNSDNIIGYVHSSNLFHQPGSIQACLRKISFVPESMEANKLLEILLRDHKSTAVVVDEFGGTAGIITLEDMLEEIFGEIEDEHDTTDLVEKELTKGRYIFSGRISIAHLNSKYGLNLEEDDQYETLAGYILFHHARIPKHQTILHIGPHQFKILRTTRTKIELVEMKKTGNL